jgi:hypothetical protein
MNDKSNAMMEYLLTHLAWGREPDDFGNADSEILDKYWSAYCIDPRKIDSRMVDLYSTLNCELSICIAGKKDKPDRLSLSLATEVFGNLYNHLHSIPKLDLLGWNPVNLGFPYQKLGKLWFVEFRSEYDGTAAFSFHQEYNAPQTYEIRSADISTGAYQDTPQLAKWALHELKRHSIKDVQLNAIRHRIDNEKLVGYEVLSELADIMDRHLGVLHGNINQQVFEELHQALPICKKLMVVI